MENGGTNNSQHLFFFVCFFFCCFFFSQYALPLARRVHTLRTMALIGAEKYCHRFTADHGSSLTG